eukprot:jgi/Chrzof1/2730/Cz11g27040.t1
MFVCIVAACGGLLYGYANAVNGGVTAMPDFQAKFFPNLLGAGAQDPYCQYNDQLLQLFSSILFLAGAGPALFGMYTCKKRGRKFTIVLGATSFIAGAALQAAAVNLAMLFVGRVLLGVGCGFVTQAGPLYLTEMAPAHLRGGLNFMFQLAVTIGILVAQLINYGASHIPDWGWRLSFALGAAPGLLLFCGGLLLPDTPNSLVQRGQMEKGKRVLQRMRGVDDVHVEFDEVCESVRAADALPRPYTTIFKKRYRPQLTVSVLIPIFQQFTGINAVIFYTPQLFQSLGGGGAAALLSTVIVGAVNVAATVLAIFMVDKLGRKVLFIEGGVQMLLSELVVGLLIRQQYSTGGSGSSSSIAISTIVVICVYVAGFAWSWGPLGWLVPSEIQPLETRAAGTAVNVSINFITTFIIVQCFLSMLCAFKYGTFFFFAGWVLLMTLFIIVFMPETRDYTIEEISHEVLPRHWFWGKATGMDDDVDDDKRYSMPTTNTITIKTARHSPAPWGEE